MKRILALSMLLLLVTSIYSEDVAQSIATVSFAGGPSYYVGFSSTAVNSVSPNPSEIEALQFKFKNGTWSTGTFYIYWKIYTQTAVDISISELNYLINVDTVPIEIPIASNDISITSLPSRIYDDTTANIPRLGSKAIDLKLSIDDTLANEIAKSANKKFSTNLKLTITTLH